MPEPKLLEARNPIPLRNGGDVIVDAWGKEYELILGEKLAGETKYYHGSSVYKLEVIAGQEYLREIPDDSPLAKWLTWGA